ncbi:MAG: nucleotidyltransferase family protein [Bacteroidales bacterium]|nr:nucleotidyltransferase family protein [Bacteroidales bacterium]
MEHYIHNIKEKIQGNFLNNNDFVSFCRYHNLHHWYSLQNINNTKIKEAIQKEYHNRKLHNLLLFNEWKKINSFANSKVNIYLFKGIALSDQIFGDITVRPTRDLDLWIHFNDLTIIDYLLKDIGYKRIKPATELNYLQKKYIHRHIHHFTYINEQKVVVELHWQLFTPKKLYPFDEHFFHTKKSHLLHHYANEWLLQYLIVHGSLHHWFKLFWLYDVHWLISHHTIQWQIFDNLTDKLNNQRLVNVAFYLSQKLFDTDIPKEIALNKTERKIAEYCVKSIYLNENYLLFKGLKRFKRIYYLSLLKKNWKFKLNVWVAPFTTTEDWKILPLPSGLFWLYYILRPFIWFYANYIKKSS